MNTYDENLNSTVTATLTGMQAQQEKLDSAETAAFYTLYYAQGAELTARDKWMGTAKTVASCTIANDQCRGNENQAFNLLATVTKVNQDVVASNGNMATAAANVQIASNAIVLLAAEIGSALNTATASLYESPVYKSIVEANAFINDTANSAKFISNEALKAAGYSSEIIAAAALSEVSTAKAKIDGLLKATQAELDKYASVHLAEGKVLGLAAIAARQAEGALSDAGREAKAIEEAYVNANRHMNQGLIVSAVNNHKLFYQFQPWPQPRALFDAKPANGGGIPEADPQYRLALVPDAKKATFTADIAAQLFSNAKGDPKQFYPVSPHNPSQVAGPQHVQMNEDVYGNKIVSGTSYVAFLYIVLSHDYKFFIGNFSEKISAPSLPFRPARHLPEARNIRIDQSTPEVGGEPDLWVRFTAAPFAACEVEFRCMLVPELSEDEEKKDHNLKMLGANNHLGKHVFFNLETALQVNPANYIVASALPLTEEAPDQAGLEDTATEGGKLASPKAYGEANFKPGSTDNFGNLIDADQKYQAYVLAVPKQYPLNQSEYVNVLSPVLKVDGFPVPAATAV